MDNIEVVTAPGMIPRFYDIYSDKSKLYTIIKAVVDELDLMQTQIDRTRDMVGIDATHGQDLYYRWGSFFMIPRLNNESDESYRSRLKLSLTALTGGTKFALQYSIAVGMGINNDQTAMNNRIKIYDAWKYTGDVPHKDNGYIVCFIDLDNQSYSSEMESIVNRAINDVKAAGVSAQVIFTNYRVVYYNELNNVSYTSLNSLKYNQIGG